MDRSLTLSKNFDNVFEEFKRYVNGEVPFDKDEERKIGMEKLQEQLEELTRLVSSLDLFSENETYDEMDPNSLRFLLLPYLLGTLWQQKCTIDRKELWTVSQVYFRDYIQRLLDHGIILQKPTILKILDSSDEDTKTIHISKMSVDDRRRYKITRFKYQKELESKIKHLEDRKKDEDDASVAQELYINLLRKYAMDAEDELESIENEKQLVNEMESALKTSTSSKTRAKDNNLLPYKTFILTKSDIQKKAFGVGYPSVPIMTVEELYQDRIAKGLWKTPDSEQVIDSIPIEDENEKLETLEETENEEFRTRQLAMDDYKDTHRRGWGNRMNRS